MSSLYPLIDTASQSPFALYFVFTAEYDKLFKNFIVVSNGCTYSGKSNSFKTFVSIIL